MMSQTPTSSQAPPYDGAYSTAKDDAHKWIDVQAFEALSTGIGLGSLRPRSPVLHQQSEDGVQISPDGGGFHGQAHGGSGHHGKDKDPQSPLGPSSPSSVSSRPSQYQEGGYGNFRTSAGALSTAHSGGGASVSAPPPSQRSGTIGTASTTETKSGAGGGGDLWRWLGLGTVARQKSMVVSEGVTSEGGTSQAQGGTRKQRKRKTKTKKVETKQPVDAYDTGDMGRSVAGASTVVGGPRRGHGRSRGRGERDETVSSGGSWHEDAGKERRTEDHSGGPVPLWGRVGGLVARHAVDILGCTLFCGSVITGMLFVLEAMTWQEVVGTLVDIGWVYWLVFSYSSVMVYYLISWMLGLPVLSSVFTKKRTPSSLL